MDTDALKFWRERNIPLALVGSERTESFDFDVAPGVMQYPHIYRGQRWGDGPERFGFSVPPDVLPEEIQAVAHVREKTGLVNFGTMKGIEIACHDVKGLIFYLQAADALNKGRDSIFRDHACSVTAHAYYCVTKRYPFFRGWIMVPEKITIASW